MVDPAGLARRRADAEFQSDRCGGRVSGMAMRGPVRPILLDDDVGEECRAARERGGVVAGDGEARGRDVGEGAVRAGPVFPVGGEVGHRAVAPFGLHEPGLGTPATSPLDEQRANEQALAEERAGDTGGLPLVIGPEVRLTIEHRAALRQPFLVNAPTPQLPPIEHQRGCRLGKRRDRRNRLAFEHADCETGRLLCLNAVANEIAAHDPLAQPHFGGPKRRRVRGPGDKPQDIGGHHRPPKDVRAVAGEDHHAVVRQRGQALQLLVQGYSDQGQHLELRRLGLHETQSEGGVPAVVRRRAADDDHQPGAWHEFKCDVDRALAFEDEERTGDVCRRPELLELRADDVHEHHRDAREQRLAVVQQEGQRLGLLHRDQIKLPSGVLLSEEFRQFGGIGGACRFGEVKVLDVKVDGRSKAALDSPPECGFQLGHRRCGAPQREEHQHRAGPLEDLAGQRDRPRKQKDACAGRSPSP